MKHNKKLTIKVVFMVLALFTLFGIGQCVAQYKFNDYPTTDFASVGFEIDPLGSIDKEGINGVISFNAVDFDWLDYEFSSQFIFNGDATSQGWSLTYLDIMFGPGILMPLTHNTTLTIGVHGGMLMRPKSIVSVSTYSGMAGWFIYGLRARGNWWLNDWLIFTISGSYDYAPDVKEKWGRINGRGGFRIVL